MIVAKLQGGMGNQLFQWAYGKYLSEKYSTPLYLDASYYNNQVGGTKRTFSLDKFPNLSYTIASDAQMGKNAFASLEDNFSYSTLKYNPDLNYYLNGYWQSEKYFMEINQTIRANLKPKESSVLELLNRYPTANSVGLHIRRTDYLTSNGYHPIQSIAYYQRALEMMRDYSNLLIFSDDINWCRQNLQFENITFVEGTTDIEDLWLMSLCKHNIIANSSFSWWGAWLNSNPTKLVVAPTNWFGPNTNLNQSDIIPNNWIKL